MSFSLSIESTLVLLWFLEKSKIDKSKPQILYQFLLGLGILNLVLEKSVSEKANVFAYSSKSPNFAKEINK